MFNNLFGNNKKSKIEVKGLTNSSVNILSFQSDPKEISKLLGSQIDDLKDIVISNNDFIYNNTSLLQTEHISKRKDVVQRIVEEWESNIWVNITGGYDTGKSQLSLLIKNELGIEGFWFTLKDKEDREFDKILFFLINKLSEQSFEEDTNYLIIFDDLPKLGLNETINNLIIRLIDSCKKNNIKLLSTSNYHVHTKIKSVIENDFIEIKIPLLVKDEIEEVIKSYTLEEKGLKYANSIELISKGYPIYVQVICKYLDKKKWALSINEFPDFLSGKSFYELTDETYDKLIITTEDEDTRELIYRLNLIFSDIDNETIRLVSEVKPEIKKPFEKLKKIKGTWLQKTEKGVYLLSPLIKRLGKDNLSSNVIVEASSILAKHILDKQKVNQYDVTNAILHFIEGKFYDEAGQVFISVMTHYISKPDLFFESTLSSFWMNTPIPNEMSSGLKASIRSLQLQILNDLKFINDSDYDTDKRDYVRDDLIKIINSNSLDVVNTIFPKLTLFRSYLLENAKKAINYFTLFIEAKKNISELNLLEFDSFFDSIWMLLHGIDNLEDIQKWFEIFTQLNKPFEVFNSKSVELFSRMLCEGIVNNSINHIETLTVLDYIYDNSEKLNLKILQAFSARAKIILLCEKFDSLNVAENFVDEIEDSFVNGLGIFLIKDELGRQQYYLNQKEKSLNTLLEIVDLNVSYITKVDLYLTLARIFGDNDSKIAHYYTLKALNYSKDQIEITALSSIKLICEYAVSLWLNKEVKESVYTFSDAYEKLLESYKKIDSFDNIDDYNITVLRIGSILNYIYQLCENGIPPDKTFNGEKYPSPKRGVFNSNYDSILLNEWYYEERKYINVYTFIRFFEFFNDKVNAIKWANIAFEMNKTIELYIFKSTLRSFIIYKIIQDEYQLTIDIKNELAEHEKNMMLYKSHEIKNKQQKQMFIKRSKQLSSENNLDDCRLIYHFIPILLRKLELLHKGKISKQDLSISLVKYLEHNGSLFNEKEPLKSVIYVLKNLPNNSLEISNLIEWLNDLDVENIELVQVICYLICSFEAEPFDALKFQLAIMAYLEKALKGVMKGAYLFLLYPLIYKFWINKVIKEPHKFYFLELWQNNLRKNTEVKNDYKLVAIYTLICMHLRYRPNEQEQGWMQNYIDYMIRDS